ncbi:MAG: GerMN domain-containing protein [Spirochaetaceae bacterium]|nr:GerMN domain-containing protein [Spirochaetaceae bacterium]
MLWLIPLNSDRYLFIFPEREVSVSGEENLRFEVRHLPVGLKDDVSDQISWYTEELLLGPVSNSLRPLFPQGTASLSCFFRDGVLYVNLSEKALFSDGNSAETETGCAIFKKNVFTNFKKVDRIVLCILDKEVYADSSLLALSLEEKR